MQIQITTILVFTDTIGPLQSTHLILLILGICVFHRHQLTGHQPLLVMLVIGDIPFAQLVQIIYSRWRLLDKYKLYW